MTKTPKAMATKAKIDKSDLLLDIQNLQRTKRDLQENNKPIQKWAKDMNRHFTKDLHEANKHMIEWVNFLEADIKC